LGSVIVPRSPRRVVARYSTSFAAILHLYLQNF
jgi:hypothetical protein